MDIIQKVGLDPDVALKSQTVPNTRKVNGKPLTADITITAADVGSVVAKDVTNVDVNTLIETGSYTIKGTSNQNWPFGNNGGSMIAQKLSDSYVSQQAYKAGTNEVRIRNKNGSTWSAWKKVYNEDFKPRADEVGALPVGTTAADVGAAPAGFGLGETTPPKKETAADITRSGFYHASEFAVDPNGGSLSCHVIVNSIDDTNKFKLYAPFSDDKVWFKKNNNAPVEFYTKANKPTATDVGALPITGGTINGGITVRDGMTITGTGKVIETIGGYIRSDRDDVMSLDGKTYSFVTAPNDAHLCGNAYSDGRAWLKYDNSKPSAYAVCGVNGEFNVFISAAGSSNPQQLKVLNVSNDGNLNVAGGVHVGSTMTLARGANDVFIHNKTSDQYLQLKNNGELHYSSNKVYHEGFKPTATDVGALPITGGTLTGGMNVTAHSIIDSPDGTRGIGLESHNGTDPYISIDRKYKAFEFKSDKSIAANFGVRNGIDRVVDGKNDVWNQFHQGSVCAFTYGINGTSGSFCINSSNGNFEWSKTLSTIDGAGDYYVTGAGYAAGGWQTGSDERFKTEIRPLGLTKDSWLDKVCSLNAKSFKYKTNDNTSVGFIAQDVQAVIPEAVTEQQVITSGSEHQDDFKDRLFIDPMAIIAAQNEAIKELVARIDALKNEVASMKNKPVTLD